MRYFLLNCDAWWSPVVSSTKGYRQTQRFRRRTPNLTRTCSSATRKASQCSASSQSAAGRPYHKCRGSSGIEGACSACTLVAIAAALARCTNLRRFIRNFKRLNQGEPDIETAQGLRCIFGKVAIRDHMMNRGQVHNFGKTSAVELSGIADSHHS
jgi:hypothetical protein